MSEFGNELWDVYIGAMTVLSVIACAVFLKMQSVHETVKGETSGHVWDGDLTEYNNPMPRWWAWLFYLTVVFALIYLVLYPGLGSFRGQLGWSQVAQLESEMQAANERFGPIYEKLAAQDVATLAGDAQALAIGQRLFLNHCAQCHASDGGGSRGFPNLTDKDWLWGGAPDAIKQTISEGRTGVMPSMAAPLGGGSAVKDVAHYVLSLSGRTHDSLRAYGGKAKFKDTCAACHGADGKGNALIGAPNLTDQIWLHGSGEAQIIETIGNGRSNQMPAHKEILTPAKIHVLTAYVMSLANGGVAGK